MSYADGSVMMPVTPPDYTRWLVGAFIVTASMDLLGSLVTLVVGVPQMNPTNPLAFAPVMFVFMGIGCFSILALVAGIVLHLMWIYRVHDDAQRGRGYREISPGLALGLSFVPGFNFVWTGLTLMRLAAFCRQNPSEGSSGANEARAAGAAFWCLIAAIVLMVLVVGEPLYGFITGFRMAQASMTSTAPVGPTAVFPFDMSEFQTPGMIVAGLVIRFIKFLCVLAYVRAVLRVQAAAYASAQPT
jgi:hypothetical protein